MVDFLMKRSGEGGERKVNGISVYIEMQDNDNNQKNQRTYYIKKQVLVLRLWPNKATKQVNNGFSGRRW